MFDLIIVSADTNLIGSAMRGADNENLCEGTPFNVQLYLLYLNMKDKVGS